MNCTVRSLQRELVSSLDPGPENKAIRSFSLHRPLTPKAMAEFGTSAIASTPRSNQPRAISTPRSGVILWSPTRISAG